QKNAYIKPLCNEYKDIIPTSIANLEKVNLNNNEEWITIRGKDKNKPILLVLSDGPGKSQMSSFNKALEDLEDNFLVVTWDQLGTGKSYKKVDDLNIDRYVSDGNELTKYLCEKYNKENVYLLGNSFGSALGILMLRDNPDLYKGFIGTSSLISVKRNEEYRYNKAIEIAENNSDEKEIRKLKAQGKPGYDKKMYKKQKVYYDYLKSKEKEDRKILDVGENNLYNIFSSEYGLLDKVNVITAEKKTYDKIFKSYYNIDLINVAKEVKVPIYFFQGSHDYLNSSDILNEYFSVLNAPDKQIVWFEKSGSIPWISEKEEFIKNINKKFLNK
ncbi:MAG: alpha/beta hydrolase, partial [Clostridium sp.]|nr:alpha/beta hydrolase [Clostridium sp.]